LTGHIFVYDGLMLSKNNNSVVDVYFDSSAMIITLILLGKFFEANAKSNTFGAIMKLMDLKADYAIVIDGDKEVKKNIEDVKIGDIVLVKPYEKIDYINNKFYNIFFL